MIVSPKNLPASEEPLRPPGIIRTLIVDDSAFVRKVVREMLSGTPFIEVVGVARDGKEALEMCATLKPDVVTCDLMMPVMDGVTFVRKQMGILPLPILILTSSAQDNEMALDALTAGAVDLVQKPTALATDQLLGVRDELIGKVKAAGRIPVAEIAARAKPVSERLSVETRKDVSRVDLIVIGISTGGPQALRQLLPQFPGNFPVPIAIVLHMPVGYTELFAQKLGEVCPLSVTEAFDGAPLRPGAIVLGRAGRHFLVRRTALGELVAELSTRPLESVHRPAVDVLFSSAAQILGPRVLGVVMTGMGDDGKIGSASIKAAGGAVITEAESSCVIYGMPRSVAEAGLSDAVVPLADMARAILQRI